MMQPEQWWNSLEDEWKKAFNLVCLQLPPTTDMPSGEQLKNIMEVKVLRFAGPRAPYPNMNFELKDLSGLEHLVNLEILVVSHQLVRTVKDISHLKKLKSLFIFDNEIDSLEGVEGLTGLNELHCHNNHISSLLPVSNLVHLHTLYCSGNNISSLEGVGAQHSDTLEKFVCMPNNGLRDREILRFEREAGIRCLRG